MIKTKKNYKKKTAKLKNKSLLNRKRSNKLKKGLLNRKRSNLRKQRKISLRKQRNLIKTKRGGTNDVPKSQIENIFNEILDVVKGLVKNLNLYNIIYQYIENELRSIRNESIRNESLIRSLTFIKTYFKKLLKKCTIITIYENFLKTHEGILKKYRYKSIINNKDYQDDFLNLFYELIKNIITFYNENCYIYLFLNHLSGIIFQKSNSNSSELIELQQFINPFDIAQKQRNLFKKYDDEYIKQNFKPFTLHYLAFIKLLQTPPRLAIFLKDIVKAIEKLKEEKKDQWVDNIDNLNDKENKTNNTWGELNDALREFNDKQNKTINTWEELNDALREFNDKQKDFEDVLFKYQLEELKKIDASLWSTESIIKIINLFENQNVPYLKFKIEGIDLDLEFKLSNCSLENKNKKLYFCEKVFKVDGKNYFIILEKSIEFENKYHSNNTSENKFDSTFDNIFQIFKNKIPSYRIYLYESNCNYFCDRKLKRKISKSNSQMVNSNQVKDIFKFKHIYNYGLNKFYIENESGNLYNLSLNSIIGKKINNIEKINESLTKLEKYKLTNKTVCDILNLASSSLFENKNNKFIIFLDSNHAFPSQSFIYNKTKQTLSYKVLEMNDYVNCIGDQVDVDDDYLINLNSKLGSTNSNNESESKLKRNSINSIDSLSIIDQDLFSQCKINKSKKIKFSKLLNLEVLHSDGNNKKNISSKDMKLIVNNIKSRYNLLGTVNNESEA